VPGASPSRCYRLASAARRTAERSFRRSERSRGSSLQERILVAHAGNDGALALDRLEALCREAGCAEEVVLELRLVAEEVLTNIAKYGFEPGATPAVEVRVALTPEDATLEFRDQGRAFDPLAQAPPDRAAPREERPLGGLGLALVRSLVDEAAYAREGATNVLRLVKRRGAQ
jgi:anti-sigma regulatory factor (Ser/Thr protein kinase)